MGEIIILVRHGESEANAIRKNQGNKNKWADTSLSKKGRLQAAKISEKFKKEKIDFIYSSKLKRAKQTSEAINIYHNKEVRLDARLGEMRNDESLEEFIERVKSVFEEVKKNKGRTVIVAHGGVNLTILALTTKNKKEGGKLVEKYRDKIENTSICVLKKQNKKYKIIEIGDCEHLQN